MSDRGCVELSCNFKWILVSYTHGFTRLPMILGEFHLPLQQQTQQTGNANVEMPPEATSTLFSTMLRVAIQENFNFGSTVPLNTKQLTHTQAQSDNNQHNSSCSYYQTFKPWENISGTTLKGLPWRASNHRLKSITDDWVFCWKFKVRLKGAGR